MRRALARAMTLSNATIPQFIVERSVDWTVLQALRAEFSADAGAGLAQALGQRFPAAGGGSSTRSSFLQ